MNEIQHLLASLDGGGETLSPILMALGLLAAFIGGQIVAWTYMWSHTGVSYSRAYVQSLVLIAIVVALIMIVVGTNIFVAFGLFGAFAVIRFRNVLKDTRDTAFIFMELAVGLAAGTWNFTALIVGVAFFTIVTLYLAFTKFGTLDTTDALAHLRAPGKSRPDIERILSLHCQRALLVSRHADSGTNEADWSWRLLLRDPDRGDELLEDLRSVEGVSDVSVHFQGDPLEA